MGPSSRVSESVGLGGAWKLAFLTRAWVMLLALGPHFENCCYRGCIFQSLDASEHPENVLRGVTISDLNFGRGIQTEIVETTLERVVRGQKDQLGGGRGRQQSVRPELGECECKGTDTWEAGYGFRPGFVLHVTTSCWHPLWSSLPGESFCTWGHRGPESCTRSSQGCTKGLVLPLNDRE